MIISDAHCHLSFLEDSALEQMLSPSDFSFHPVFYFQGGYDPQDWQKQIYLSKIYPQIVTCLGMHPWYLDKINTTDMEVSWQLLKDLLPQARLIGETGFDFSLLKNSPSNQSITQRKNKQRESFIRHLIEAQNLKKPLIIHTVKAHEETLHTLSGFVSKNNSFKGIIHAFNGSAAVAKRYLSYGFFISVGPQILSKNALHLIETIKTIGMEYLVLESDQPKNRKTLLYDANVLNLLAESLSKHLKMTVDEVVNQHHFNLSQLMV